jgi:hypothetical protein
VGGLARYQYLNMDQVVGQALATFERMLERGVARLEDPPPPGQPQALEGVPAPK